MRPIPQIAIDKAQELEELVLRAYDDKHPKKILQPGDEIEGTLTGGYGHTGSDVSIGMTIDKALADSWLEHDLETAASHLTKKIGPDIVELLTEEQFAALLLFVLNLGTGKPDRPEWTIWKRLRAKQFDQVPLEMQKFVNWGDPPQKSSGLVKRRNAEVELWAVNEPGTVDEPAPPSSVTRNSITPPTPSDPVPASKSKALLLGGVGAVAGAGPMANQVSQAIQPYAHASHYVEKALGILAAIAAFCAAAGLAYMWLQKRQARN
jgi:lysozyme